MCIYYDKLTNEFKDSRFSHLNIFDKQGISVCYTTLEDDITKGKKPPQTPYTDRRDELIYKDGVWIGEKTDSLMRAEPFLNGIKLDISTSASIPLSEYGVNLSLNFMGKKQGGGWKNQYLFNSPYISQDKNIIYTYLTSPSGNNLVIAVLSEADGWKMDYSSYCWGHYFVNLKILANYDKAYGTGSKRNHLSIGIFPVKDFESCLNTLSQAYNLPFLNYDLSGGKIGTEISLSLFGKCDEILEEYSTISAPIKSQSSYTVSREGETTLVPVYNGKRGGAVTVYGYSDIYSLYKKSMESVDLEVIRSYTDGNLCEHQCWASATLRFLMKYKDKLTSEEIDRLEAKVISLLDVITEEDEEKATPHRTILNKPHDNFPAYNVYKSPRVQELFFGITILLDAYKYFGNEKYLTYAVGAIKCAISHYQKEDGRIEVDWGNDAREDYSTVCCPMIPLCDMANHFKGTDFGDFLENSCDALALHLYNRGLSFPTEGGKSDIVEEEMEDGSISCTALALLYYCYNLKRNEAYIEKAKEILDIHESWIINTPICQMHRSSLRWWETQWEGDADGPAICAGHAWSIWRGEADLLYYLLTKDNDYRIKAENTFMTNLSKIQGDGTTYSTYNPDEINGGGFSDKAESVKFQIAPKFSSREDCGISRYVWIRIGNYI